MIPYVPHIAGQAPSLRWKRNVGKKKRTIEEAVEKAKEHGVAIPEDVEFVEAKEGELRGSWEDFFTGEGETAKGPDVSEDEDQYIHWQSHYNRFHKIRFRIHPEVLSSDEGIVAVFTHEMAELACLRELFAEVKLWRMNALDYGTHVLPEFPNNCHDKAWDKADEAVLKMRREGKQ
jgi:hypothetical protein